jgi:hypothetical protein
MNIIATSTYGGTPRHTSLEDHAIRALDGDDYGRGLLEAAAATAANNSRAIGRLLTVLAEKEAIDLDDAETILGGGYKLKVAP